MGPLFDTSTLSPSASRPRRWSWPRAPGRPSSSPGRSRAAPAPASTAFGLEIGTAVHTLAAALGLSAILATSATAFAVVKYLGAAYLVFLGVRTLRSRPATAEPGPGTAPRTPTGHLLAHATMTGILTPRSPSSSSRSSPSS